MNHFHVVSYTLDNRLADNVVKATRQSANDAARNFREQYGHGRSVGILPCDNKAHKLPCRNWEHRDADPDHAETRFCTRF